MTNINDIYVTKPYLPNIEKYLYYVSSAFEAGALSNNGVLLQELEKRLKEYLGVENIICVANGTIALEVAVKTYLIENNLSNIDTCKIITSPFSFAATSSAIEWLGRTPTYSEVDKNGLLDPKNIHIKPGIPTLVLATHVYGNLCNQKELNKVAGAENIIYDASHCFGVQSEESFWEFGFASTVSFHATKVFTTGEGGAIIFASKESEQLARKLINFGITNERDIIPHGINGKMSELHAALGLSNLENIDEALSLRRNVGSYYKSLLNFCDYRLMILDNKKYQSNFGYFPLEFDDEKQCELIFEALKSNGIFARRYFSKSLNTVGYSLPQRLAQSEQLCRKVLCLPIYPELKLTDVSRICRIVNKR